MKFTLAATILFMCFSAYAGTEGTLRCRVTDRQTPHSIVLEGELEGGGNLARADVRSQAFASGYQVMATWGVREGEELKLTDRNFNMRVITPEGNKLSVNGPYFTIVTPDSSEIILSVLCSAIKK